MFLLWQGNPAPASAQAPALPAHRVVVLLVPGLRADDLTRPSLSALADMRAEGAAGWMICRAARATNRRQLALDGRDSLASLALTLGSGERRIAETKEEAGKRESLLLSADSKSKIENRKSKIGDVVHAQGWRVTVYGNAATSANAQEGLLLAADSDGRVDVAQTQALQDSTTVYAPYGLRDDVEMLSRVAAALSERDALQVLVFGDLARADAYGSLCLPAQRAEQRLTALRSLNGLLSALRAKLPTLSGAPIQLMLLSPAPADSTDKRDRLAPILLWGRDIPAGILTSPSTRTSGIVVNTDFLPTLAHSLGLASPPGAIGRAFVVQPYTRRNNSLADWQTAHDCVMQSERLKDVYGGLPTLQCLLVIAALVLYHRKQRRFACAVCVAIVALPFALLMLPPLPFVPQSISGAGVILTVVVLAFAAIAWRLYPSRHGVPLLLTVLFAALLGAITLDLLSGSLLLRHAWMSYSLQEAARFYGIGNEYMGVVIGAACILLGKREEKKKRRKEEKKKESITQTIDRNQNSTIHSQLLTEKFSSLLLFFSSSFLLFLLGYSHFGAKVGAVPSAGIAFGVEGWMLWRGRLRGRDLLLIVGVLALGLGGLLLLDLRHGAGEQSHFAQAFAGSGGGLFAAASRKLLLEGYLLLHSPWSAALFAASLGFAYILREEKKKRRKEEKRIEEDNREKEKGKLEIPSTLNPQLSTYYGLVAGALASLLCNDSGVTAAAMIMLFGFAQALTQAVDRERLTPWKQLTPPTAETIVEVNAHDENS